MSGLELICKFHVKNEHKKAIKFCKHKHEKEYTLRTAKVWHEKGKACNNTFKGCEKVCYRTSSFQNSLKIGSIFV